MTNDEQVVKESDLALVRATMAYERASVLDRLKMADELNEARQKWGVARYRLLFPDTIATQADVQEAQRIRTKVESAADKQAMAQALLDLAGLLAKFAH